MQRIIIAAILAAAFTLPAVGWDRPAADPIVEWSNEARKAIVPMGAGGVFGPENYGTKFPGEAAVYMAIVHAAIFDAALAFEGGYQPYAIELKAPRGTSPEAAIATAAHHVLVGILDPPQQAVLNAHYSAYMNALDTPAAKAQGVVIGEQVAAAMLALRAGDGREKTPTITDLDPPPAGAGVWDPGQSTAVGLRLPGIKPLALRSASQFRPDGPSPLRGREYAEDFKQVAELGRADSPVRGDEQTQQALFWTDHDLRQWNDGLLALAAARRLDRLDTARMLAMAHVAGGDAMIACFDAKYTYWFWRPYQAIPRAGEDGNRRTDADPAWQPLRTTPNFPEYPSAHACHSAAVSTVLAWFFGTDRIPFSLDSRATMTLRTYERFRDVVKDVNLARVLVGFHFFASDQEGAALGRKVADYVIEHRFQPTARDHGRGPGRSEP